MKVSSRKIIEFTSLEATQGLRTNDKIDKLEFLVFRKPGAFVHILLELVMHKKMLKLKGRRSRSNYFATLKLFPNSITPALMSSHSLALMLIGYWKKNTSSHTRSTK
jgi:hypothetical protein